VDVVAEPCAELRAPEQHGVLEEHPPDEHQRDGHGRHHPSARRASVQEEDGDHGHQPDRVQERAGEHGDRRQPDRGGEGERSAPSCVADARVDEEHQHRGDRVLVGEPVLVQHRRRREAHDCGGDHGGDPAEAEQSAEVVHAEQQREAEGEEHEVEAERRVERRQLEHEPHAEVERRRLGVEVPHALEQAIAQEILTEQPRRVVEPARVERDAGGAVEEARHDEHADEDPAVDADAPDEQLTNGRCPHAVRR
jgi:hypothetical protein